MSAPTPALDDLVTANRILAREGVVDSFGHVSIRHPDRPDRYILSRARAPECIEIEDLMEFALDGAAIDAAGRKPYAERYIHGGVYRARLQLNADLQMKAGALGDPTFLSDGEIAAVLRTRGSFTYERAWEFWCRRAGRRYDAGPMEGPQSGA